MIAHPWCAAASGRLLCSGGDERQSHAAAAAARGAAPVRMGGLCWPLRGLQGALRLCRSCGSHVERSGPSDPGLKLSTANQSCVEGLKGLSPLCYRDPGTSAIHSGCMSCLAQKRQALSGCLPSMLSSCCAASCSFTFWLGPASCLAFPSAYWLQHHSGASFVAIRTCWSGVLRLLPDAGHSDGAAC